MEPTFNFRSESWEYEGKSSWFFVALPTDQADEIGDLETERRGFGSVKVRVMIGTTEWGTSIFPSNAAASYLLPVERAVREGEQPSPGDIVEVAIRVVLP